MFEEINCCKVSVLYFLTHSSKQSLLQQTHVPCGCLLIFINFWGDEKGKSGEIFACPLQLPLTPETQTCPFDSSHQPCKSDLEVGVWFIVIFFDYLALLVKHLWSSFDTSRSHCSLRRFFTSGMYNKLTGEHTKSFILKSKSYTHYQIVQLLFK